MSERARQSEPKLLFTARGAGVPTDFVEHNKSYFTERLPPRNYGVRYHDNKLLAQGRLMLFKPKIPSKTVTEDDLEKTANRYFMSDEVMLNKWNNKAQLASYQRAPTIKKPSSKPVRGQMARQAGAAAAATTTAAYFQKSG